MAEQPAPQPAPQPAAPAAPRPQSGPLVRYDAARSALAAACRVDEVKDVRDKALALAAYARQAKDDEMVSWALELKFRAERRAGELLRESASVGQRNWSGRPKKPLPSGNGSLPTLADVGLTRRQSFLWQKLAAVPEPEFEQVLAEAAEPATTSGLLSRAAELARERRQSEPGEQLPQPELAAPDRPTSEVLLNRTRAMRGIEGVATEFASRPDVVWSRLNRNAVLFKSNSSWSRVPLLTARLDGTKVVLETRELTAGDGREARARKPKPWFELAPDDFAAIAAGVAERRRP